MLLCISQNYRIRRNNGIKSRHISKDENFTPFYFAFSIIMPTFVPPYKRKPGWRNGRRAGFRYQWSNIRIGSTPISGTYYSCKLLSILFCYVQDAFFCRFVKKLCSFCFELVETSIIFVYRAWIKNLWKASMATYLA